MTESTITERIRNDVENHDIVLFMKGSKKIPQCGFSAAVVQVLERVGANDFKDINVLTDNELREGIKAYTDWPTIPQLYVKGEFVGGCDIVREMFFSGELAQLMQEKGIALSPQAA